MNAKLDDLSTRFRPLACELIARIVEAKIDVRIIETLRTAERQAELIEQGVSWTVKSKHIAGEAIDLAPTAVLALKGWAPGHSHWRIMGEIGERLGLRWGGRWKIPDCAHFELKEE